MNIAERARFLPPSRAEDAAEKDAEQRTFHALAHDRLADAYRAVEELDDPCRPLVLEQIEEASRLLGNPDETEEVA